MPPVVCALPMDLRDVVRDSVSVLDGERDPAKAERALIDALRVSAPSMRRRKWTVGALSEFFPARSQQLYGINSGHGAKILIRLRAPGDRAQLLEPHVVLHTLLHELVHNVHSNHSAEFYDLLEVLRDEAAAVQVRQAHGVSEPLDGRFWGRGARLGGSRPPPSAPFPKGGRKLGGARPPLGVSARGAAARAAIARAAEAARPLDLTRDDEDQDNTACGCSQNQHSPPSHSLDRPAWICAGCQYVNDLEAVACDVCLSQPQSRRQPPPSLALAAAPTPPATKRPRVPGGGRAVVDLTTSPAAAAASARSAWTCQACTFVNPPGDPRCVVCAELQPDAIVLLSQ
jgi:hypothetical protein